MITDQTAVENYILTEIDSSLYNQFVEWVNGVEEEMNKMTGRQLIAPSEFEEEYMYDGNGKCSIMIDDFISISKIEVDDEDITDDCYLYPSNKVPKWQIKSTLKFSRGHQNVVITGVKGYTTLENLPSDLKWAATVLVSGIINFSNSSEGEVQSETIGRYSVTYTTDAAKDDHSRAMSIIKRYRKIR